MNKLLLILTLLSSIAITSRAQNVIRGKVVDTANGEPIIGASVIISGTKTGTVTDNEGRFQISIKKGQKLTVSYLGKKTCECMARDNVRIELEDDSRNINDVVVVAYGTRQRHDLTGSIASINSASITENPVTSLEQAMEGKLPGVQVTQGGGMPGAVLSRSISAAPAASRPATSHSMSSTVSRFSRRISRRAAASRATPSAALPTSIRTTSRASRC